MTRGIIIGRIVLTVIALITFGAGFAFPLPDRNKIAHPDSGDSSVILNFRFEKSVIDRGFLSNGQALARIDVLFSNSDPALIDSIVIYGYSSPDGPARANWRVAGERAESVRKYITSRFPFVDASRIRTCNGGEDLAGLRNMIAADHNMPERENVIMLLDSGITGDTLENRINDLDKRAMRHIILNMSRFLRSSVIYVKYAAPQPADTTANQAGAEPVADRPAASDSVTTTQSVQRPATSGPDAPLPAIPDPGLSAGKNGTCRFPFMGFKTNLLYYPLLMPNIEAEYYIGRRWSANVEYQIAWWEFPRRDRFYQIQMGGPELRYWLREGDFTGHYFGAYGTIGCYDLKMGEKGYMSNSLWSAGISWGYLLPLRGRLSLEFGLAVGYMYTNYDEYVRNDALGKHYDYLYTSETSYFGPTKAKIGLVLRTGKKGKR